MCALTGRRLSPRSFSSHWVIPCGSRSLRQFSSRSTDWIANAMPQWRISRCGSRWAIAFSLYWESCWLERTTWCWSLSFWPFAWLLVICVWWSSISKCVNSIASREKASCFWLVSWQIIRKCIVFLIQIKHTWRLSFRVIATRNWSIGYSLDEVN